MADNCVLILKQLVQCLVFIMMSEVQVVVLSLVYLMIAIDSVFMVLVVFLVVLSVPLAEITTPLQIRRVSINVIAAVSILPVDSCQLPVGSFHADYEDCCGNGSTRS